MPWPPGTQIRRAGTCGLRSTPSTVSSALASCRSAAAAGVEAVSRTPCIPNIWGRGIGTVVAAQLIRFAFEKLGLHRVEGTCDPRNLASAAILRKVGMTREGQLREMIELRDGWRDSEIYSILDGESSPKPRR